MITGITRIEVHGDRLLVRPSLADLAKCQQIGGHWDRRHNAWSFPASRENAVVLSGALKTARSTPDFDAILTGSGDAATGDSGEVVVVASPEVLPPASASPTPQFVKPAGIKTDPWRHQVAAIEFCQERFAKGRRGTLLAMGMGCVDGDADLHINRGGCARHITLREFYGKFHGGETRGRIWKHFPTLMRSVIGGELPLNQVLDVIAQGVKPVVRVTLASGKSLRVTPDHEFARPGDAWTEAAKLAAGDIVLTTGAAVYGAANARFMPTPDTVVSVEPDGETDVYDVRMAAPGHNFVANGIIVHNCGKSLTTLALLLLLDARRVIIICPLRVVQVWITEIAAHIGVDLIVVALDEAAGSTATKLDLAQQKLRLAETLGVPFICVVNYDSVWRDPLAAWLERQRWDVAVADELHRGKGVSGRASMFLKRLRRSAAYRIGLTGTPMPHGPMDIYAQFRFLDITIFGPSFTAFRAKYAVMGGYQRKEIVGYQSLPELEALISEITFRVGSEVLDLPPATHVTYYCDLCPEARRVYRVLEKNFVAEVEGGVVAANNALSRLNALRRIANGIAKTENGIEHRIDDSKAKLLSDVLEDIGKDEPVAVFCYYHLDLDAVHEACQKVGFSSLELSGRRDELKQWQDGAAQVLAVQLQAGGVGINLVRARYSIYYSLSFSLGDYDQSQKRIHRPGQTRPVEYIHLVARNTVDVKIMRALERRAQIVESILAEIKNTAS